MIGASRAYREEEATMASIAADDGAQSVPAVENLGRRRAAGIYGAIITAAILLVIGAYLPFGVKAPPASSRAAPVAPPGPHQV